MSTLSDWVKRARAPSVRWTGKIPGFCGLGDVGDGISIAGAKERSRLQGQWSSGHRGDNSEGEEQIREIQIWCSRDSPQPTLTWTGSFHELQYLPPYPKFPYNYTCRNKNRQQQHWEPYDEA